MNIYRSGNDSSEKQYVYLKGDSHIKGNIIFEQASGEMIIEAHVKLDSQII